MCNLAQAQENLEPGKRVDPRSEIWPALVDFCADRFLAAFYFALRDTLVANSIDEAVVISKAKDCNQGRRWRVVTMDGMKVEAVGTLEGGGDPNRMRRGKSSVLSRWVSEKNFARVPVQ